MEFLRTGTPFFIFPLSTIRTNGTKGQVPSVFVNPP